MCGPRAVTGSLSDTACRMPATPANVSRRRKSAPLPTPSRLVGLWWEEAAEAHRGPRQPKTCRHDLDRQHRATCDMRHSEAGLLAKQVRHHHPHLGRLLSRPSMGRDTPPPPKSRARAGDRVGGVRISGASTRWRAWPASCMRSRRVAPSRRAVDTSQAGPRNSAVQAEFRCSRPRKSAPHPPCQPPMPLAKTARAEARAELTTQRHPTPYFFGNAYAIT